jgi:hypothetical protein
MSEEIIEVHGGGEIDDEAENEHRQPLIILFIFAGLCIGGILREFTKKTKFPYTPLLIIVGMLLGHFRNYLGVIGESTSILSRINPYFIFYKAFF